MTMANSRCSGNVSPDRAHEPGESGIIKARQVMSSAIRIGRAVRPAGEALNVICAKRRYMVPLTWIVWLLRVRLVIRYPISATASPDAHRLAVDLSAGETCHFDKSARTIIAPELWISLTLLDI